MRQRCSSPTNGPRPWPLLRPFTNADAAYPHPDGRPGQRLRRVLDLSNALVLYHFAEQGVRSVASPAGAACDGWDAVEEGEGLGDVVAVVMTLSEVPRPSQVEWYSLPAFPPVDRRRTGVGPLTYFARMKHRRQQVNSEPNLSYSSRSCPALSPVEHEQDALETELVRHRPGLGDLFGQWRPSGSLSAHWLSSTIHGRVVRPSRTTESSHRGHGQPGHCSKIASRALGDYT